MSKELVTVKLPMLGSYTEAELEGDEYSAYLTLRDEAQYIILGDEDLVTLISAIKAHEGMVGRLRDLGVEI